MIDEKFQYRCDVCGVVVPRDELKWSESDRRDRPRKTWHYHGEQSGQSPCWVGLLELQRAHYATTERVKD